MLHKSLGLSLCIGLLAFAVAGCTGEAPVISATTPAIVALPDGLKSDNYVSTNAREFILSGTAHTPLPTGLESLDETARARDGASRKASALGPCAGCEKAQCGQVAPPS